MANILTLGEIMLRLSTDIGVRLNETQQLICHYGGGEANVAISLANFGHQVSFASKVPDNSLGQAAVKHLRRNGVMSDFVQLGGAHLGTYYMETGIGERAASVTYDRAGSSFAEVTEFPWSYEKLFSGIELFHISGITAALSVQWCQWTVELVKAAKKFGVLVSFDINYRGKLWSQAAAGKALKEILPYVDYCSAGELDARYLLEIPEDRMNSGFVYYYQQMQQQFPNIKCFYSTKRIVSSASNNQLVGTLWLENTYYESEVHKINPIVDRVGGGDAFAAGILHGLISDFDGQRTVEFATAASALKHTVHGDCNQFSEIEIEQFLTAGSGRIVR
ncbi:PfkB family carbohydrate kinase [Enterococcus faecalis]|uniref:PfkB family carbohydrate kinase n=1 Tax=Enterococcus faecalis TaxID=1351 RepID=UPI0039874B87